MCETWRKFILENFISIHFNLSYYKVDIILYIHFLWDYLVLIKCYSWPCLLSLIKVIRGTVHWRYYVWAEKTKFSFICQVWWDCTWLSGKPCWEVCNHIHSLRKWPQWSSDICLGDVKHVMLNGEWEHREKKIIPGSRVLWFIDIKSIRLVDTITQKTDMLIDFSCNQWILQAYYFVQNKIFQIYYINLQISN